MRWLLLWLLAAAEHCPVYLCAEEEAMDCLQVNSTHVVLSPCPNDLLCPAFSMYHPESLTCQSSAGYEAPKQKPCKGMKSEGDLCTTHGECGEWLYCAVQRDLTHRCAPVLKVGKQCQENHMCRAGAMCHNGLCQEYFTVPAGEAASSKLACQSARIADGICLPLAESIAPIPVQCSDDSDCQATDGSFSECMCGRNAQRQKFCALHPSDAPVKLFLETVHNEFMDTTGLVMMEMVHYPILQQPEDCFFEAAQEFIELKAMQELSARCASVLLTASFLLVS